MQRKSEQDAWRGAKPAAETMRQGKAEKRKSRERNFKSPSFAAGNGLRFQDRMQRELSVGRGTRNELIDKNGVLCRHMNMNQNGTHKSFRQTSALTTWLSAHTHIRYAHTGSDTHTHAFGWQINEGSKCVLHISSGSAWLAMGNVFVINPLKVKDEIHVACLLMHTDTHRHVHTRARAGRQTHNSSNCCRSRWHRHRHKVALINETH